MKRQGEKTLIPMIIARKNPTSAWNFISEMKYHVMIGRTTVNPVYTTAFPVVQTDW